MAKFHSPYDWVVFHCIYTLHLLYPFSVNGHSGCLHTLPIVNNAAVNTGNLMPCLVNPVATNTRDPVHSESWLFHHRSRLFKFNSNVAIVKRIIRLGTCHQTFMGSDHRPSQRSLQGSPALEPLIRAKKRQEVWEGTVMKGKIKAKRNLPCYLCVCYVFSCSGMSNSLQPQRR